MSRIRRASGVLLAVALMNAPLSAQTAEERVDAALARAQESGIPVALLTTKVAEGQAKGVSMDRIAQAVEQRLAVLQQVRERIGESYGLDPAELGVAADAIQSGVSAEVLEAIAANAQQVHRAVAFAAVTQLVQVGQSNQEALEQVMEALARGAEALMALPAQAAEAVARRGPPDGAGAQGRGGPPSGVPPGSRGRGRGRGTGGG